MALSHVEGATFFRMRLLGTSQRIYGMKKINRAIL